MIKHLFYQLANITDGGRSIRYIQDVMATDCLFTYPAYRRTAEFCAEELRRLGSSKRQSSTWSLSTGLRCFE